MVYVMIYLTVGVIWALYQMKLSFRRYRIITHDQKRSKKQQFKDYLIMGSMLLVQCVLFWWAQMYYTIKRGGKLNG